MAQTVTRFSFPVNPPRMPWSEWLDGRIWRLSRKDWKDGTGYTARGFAIACSYAARVRCGRALVHHDRGSDTIHIRYVPRPENETGKPHHPKCKTVDFAKSA